VAKTGGGIRLHGLCPAYGIQLNKVLLAIIWLMPSFSHRAAFYVRQFLNLLAGLLRRRAPQCFRHAAARPLPAFSRF